MDIVFQFWWRFRFPVGFRLSVQFSTVLVHLVATGRVSPSSGIFNVWPLCNLKLSPFELYSCRAHRVLCL